MAIGDLKAQIQTVDGNVRTAVALLEKQGERQDRTDRHIDKLEVEIDRVREEARKEIAEAKKSASDQIHAINIRLAKWGGAIALVTIAIPIVLKFGL